MLLPVCLYLLDSPEKSTKESPDLTGAVRPVKSGLFCFEDGGLYAERAGYCLYAADIGRRG